VQKALTELKPRAPKTGPESETQKAPTEPKYIKVSANTVSQLIKSAVIDLAAQRILLKNFLDLKSTSDKFQQKFQKVQAAANQGGVQFAVEDPASTFSKVTDLASLTDVVTKKEVAKVIEEMRKYLVKVSQLANAEKTLRTVWIILLVSSIVILAINAWVYGWTRVYGVFPIWPQQTTDFRPYLWYSLAIVLSALLWGLSIFSTISCLRIAKDLGVARSLYHWLFWPSFIFLGIVPFIVTGFKRIN
jgi:hypothetical protein